MKPFAAPLDDIFFVLDHVVDTSGVPGYDRDTTREIATHFAAFAEAVIAPTDEIGDRVGARLEGGRVVLPPEFHEMFAQYVEGGWPGLMLPEEHGGMGVDGVTGGVVHELLMGANHAFQMLVSLAVGHARVLEHFGTEDQRVRYLPKLASGDYLGTMALTEPGAGSDLSRIRCKAVQDGEVWRITGEKIFISGGDQDLSPGILHMVLARTGDMDSGVKGLSLFACTSDRADGGRNAIKVTRIEEKMGLHAQPTCQLAFDGAEAELIGAEGQGLRAMFEVMNHARVDVALQGVAHAARAYDIASSYAAERQQGRDATGPVTIERHGDVRRMLDEIDSVAMGARAMTHLALVTLESGSDPWLLELLTHVIKWYATEEGLRAAQTGMQVLGGYGYLTEYRIEQTYRDLRIAAIYEGASGIHAMGLAGRLLRLENGAAMDAFARFVSGVEGEATARALSAWEQARAHLEQGADPGPIATPFIRLTSRVLEQAMWARMAAAADHHPDPARIRRVAALVARQVARCEADLAEMLAV
ncbi:acyl-CoA dehydrogenase family protein [uncultured Maritimibacter sp.]|jgi:alkylation response protein AidB-like acyl-CoA dehydrogenase|uniref:acyl-CoA dehydrogenase family protein n=1 Tax=uncultured Maritimibacter sp. TaxID=991866 RepID=UPI000A874FCE|nr:acyl-CoA dehydrogenase family protein [uncultured Maritimibacter sp.]